MNFTPTSQVGLRELLVGHDLQDILDMIRRNQEQIDLLSSNNTLLVKALLQEGMIQNVRELNLPIPFLNPQIIDGTAIHPKFSPKKKGRPAKALLNAMPPALVPPQAAQPSPEPATEPTKKTKKKAARAPKYQPVEKPGDLAQSDYVLKFIYDHGGEFRTPEFRAATHTQDFGPSFFETTMYTVLRKLCQAGTMVKLGVGHYALTKKEKTKVKIKTAKQKITAAA